MSQGDISQIIIQRPTQSSGKNPQKITPIFEKYLQLVFRTVVGGGDEEPFMSMGLSKRMHSFLHCFLLQMSHDH